MKILVEEPKTFANNRDTSRSYQKYDEASVVVDINQQKYPVINWGIGGMLVFADGRFFSKGDTINFNMLFNIGDYFTEMKHTGTVMRSNEFQIAVNFDDLNKTKMGKLQKVMDKFADFTASDE